MKKKIQLLSVLVLIQVALVAFSLTRESTLQERPSASTPLLDFQVDQISRLEIQGSDGQTVALKNKDGAWLTETDFPVKANQVESLLQQLSGLEQGLSIANTEDSIKRFKLSEDNYERRIQLQTGSEKPVTLYLGSGAGAGQTHVRRAGESAVYTARIGTYSAPVEASGWEDTAALQLKPDSVKSLRLGELEVAREAPAAEPEPTDSDGAKASAKADEVVWGATTPLPDGGIFDTAAFKTALNSLCNLRFSKTLGKTAPDAFGDAAASLEVTLGLEDGERTYQLKPQADSEDFVLKVSDNDFYFEISHATGQSLIDGFSTDKLIQLPQVEEPAEPAAAESASSGDAPKDASATN